MGKIVQPYWVYPSMYPPKASFLGSIPKLEFFDLPKVFASIREHYRDHAERDMDYSWEDRFQHYRVNIGNILYWGLNQFNDQITTCIDQTKLDIFYNPRAIPQLLDLILDKEYHSSVYALLLEYYPEDTNLQTWYNQSLTTQA